MIRLGSFLLPLLWVAWGCGTRKQQTTAAPQSMDTAALQELYFAAEVHYIQGNWKQSDSLFRRYARSTMPPGAAYHRLACIASKTGQTDEALVWNSRARQADSTVEEWLLLDADLQRNKGNYQAAGDIYAAYTLKNPRSWTCYNDAARCYAMGDEWSAILKLCKRWEKEFGLMEPIVEYESQALNMLNQPIKAAELWGALRRKYPDRPIYRYKQINTLKEGGATESAQRLLDTLISQDPQDAELQALYCGLISVGTETPLPPYLLQIAQTKSMSFQSKWECLEPFSSPVHPAYDSCESLLRALYKAHPKETEVMKVLGMWCLFHGEAAEAAQFLKQALNEGKQSLELWQQYLTAISLGCETSKMILEADTLLELYAMLPGSYRMKAIAFFVNGKTEDALNACNNGERFSDNNTALSALKLYIQLQTGLNTRKPEQAMYFEDSSVITDALMLHVQWALSQNRHDEASNLLRILFDNPKMLNEQKFSGYEKGDYWSFFQCVILQARLSLITQKNKEATIALLKMYLPESPVALELMGDLYGTQDADAIACYERALLCTSYMHKDRLLQKINSLRNR